MNRGKVVLVGAGPGDAGLLTVNAVEEIKKAQVIVFDRLVSEDIMNLLPQTAEKIDVGKNAGEHPVPQNEINDILLKKALEGKYVVRLKGGDSFVFGRGGEELELLEENNIPFRTVPGITSAIAAAAYAGIPVTHRDFCSSVHIITGHKRENGKLVLDYESLTKLNGTLVFLMSVSSAGEIAQGLIKSGMDKYMPCAVIENGTRPYQRKVVSVLGTLKEDLEKNKIKSPAIIIVGKVCQLSDRFDWFDKLPLKGKKIVIGKTKSVTNKTAEKLTYMGAQVKLIPSIDTEYVDFDMPDITKQSTAVFTSGAGIHAFFKKLKCMGKDTRALGMLKFAVVGRETAKILSEYGIEADFIPSVFNGENLAKEMIESGFCKNNHKLLLFRGNIASEKLNEILDEKNIDYEERVVYKTVEKCCEAIDIKGYEYAVFTSASSVNTFFENTAGCEKDKIMAVCIGRQTEKAAKEKGLKTVVSNEATINSLVEKLMEICKNKNRKEV